MEKFIPVLILVTLISCNLKDSHSKKSETEPEISGKGSELESSNKQVDTVYNYWQIDTDIYDFDTILLSEHISIKTYCLNDSSLFGSPSERTTDSGKVVVYYIAHNYESKVTFNNNSKEREYTIRLETFKESLPEEFLQIAHLWYNEYEKIDNSNLLMRAKIAQPDTDNQYDIIYFIDSRGSIRIEELLYE